MKGSGVPIQENMNQLFSLFLRLYNLHGFHFLPPKIDKIITNAFNIFFIF